MGPQEKALRDQYRILCTDLGDAVTQKRHAEKKIADIEGEIDRLQAALPDAQRVDQQQASGQHDHGDHGQRGEQSGQDVRQDRTLPVVQGTGLHASHGAESHDEPAQEAAGDVPDEKDSRSHGRMVPVNGAAVNPGVPG